MSNHNRWKKTPLIFIEEGVKIDQHVCLNTMKGQLVPWINPTFMECGITLQQNRATSHTANLVQEWCNKKMVGFWTKELRPPPSPDFYPMDFAVWSILESNACSSYYPSVTSLKAKLKHCWDKISTETIYASCNQVTDRLKCVVEAKGGYIEK